MDWTRFVGVPLCCKAQTLLRNMPDDCVDLVLTDPPWGCGKRYATYREPTDKQENYRLLAPVYRECLRVLKPSGVLIMFQAGMSMKYWRDWFGGYSTGYIRRRNWRHYVADEFLIQNKDRQPVPLAQQCYDDLDDWRTDPPPANSHPCPKQVSTMRLLIRDYSQPGQIVLDPYGGIFTTAVAAVREGRQWLSCDIALDYVRVGRRRLREM